MIPISPVTGFTSTHGNHWSPGVGSTRTGALHVAPASVDVTRKTFVFVIGLATLGLPSAVVREHQAKGSRRGRHDVAGGIQADLQIRERRFPEGVPRVVTHSILEGNRHNRSGPCEAAVD